MTIAVQFQPRLFLPPGRRAARWSSFGRRIPSSTNAQMFVAHLGQGGSGVPEVDGLRPLGQGRRWSAFNPFAGAPRIGKHPPPQIRPGQCHRPRVGAAENSKGLWYPTEQKSRRSGGEPFSCPDRNNTNPCMPSDQSRPGWRLFPRPAADDSPPCHPNQKQLQT